MPDEDCVLFLQWALPRLDLAWLGFRKVRGQVCKRIKRRMHSLGVASFADYRARLETDPREWQVLDSFCRITISRFWRDRSTFAVLRQLVLPEMAMRAAAEKREARIWSVGCASGEEPYSLRILWDLEVSPRFPDAPLGMVATDRDETLLDRARRACYPRASLREFPPELAVRAFTGSNGFWCLKPAHRQGVLFLQQDVRQEAPPGRFDLVLCRNLAFTYFAGALQEAVLSGSPPPLSRAASSSSAATSISPARWHGGGLLAITAPSSCLCPEARALHRHLTCIWLQSPEARISLVTLPPAWLQMPSGSQPSARFPATGFDCGLVRKDNARWGEQPGSPSSSPGQDGIINRASSSGRG